MGIAQGRKPGAERGSGLTPLVGGGGLLAMLVGLYIII